MVKRMAYIRNQSSMVVISQLWRLRYLAQCLYSKRMEVIQLNQVACVGRTTKDLEVRYVGEKKQPVARFTLAVNRHFKNNQGMIEADFLTCTIWGKAAENMQKYCGKGSLISVTGRLQSSSYVNKQEERVYTTEIIVTDVRFLSSKKTTTDPDPRLPDAELLSHFTAPGDVLV